MPRKKYGWLRTLFGNKKREQDEEYANCSPWTREMWEAPIVARPPIRTPIVISSNGLFTSRQELQRIAGEPEVSELALTTTVFLPGEQEELHQIRYCDVSVWQYFRICDETNGERITVWFQGEERVAWLAYSFKDGRQKAEETLTD